MEKITFFGTHSYDRANFTAANADFNFDLHFLRSFLDEHTVKYLEGARAVCVFVNDNVNRQALYSLKDQGVELVALRCAGFNNVDLQAAKSCGIRVVRVPAYSPHAIAEHVVALLLTLNRKTHRANLRTRDGNFALHGLMGFDLFDKTAGIIGTGKIARVLIKILQGFGMHILAYDPYPDLGYAEQNQVQYVDLKTLYAKSDVISLNCPLTSENRHLINREAIEGMKKGVYVINTGRGPLIDTQALIEGLKNGTVGAAGLDVYEEESSYFFEDRSDKVIRDDNLSRLLSYNNVLITSHQAFFTQEAMHSIALTTLANCQEYFEGRPLSNEVCSQA
ncbi:MAG: 2-hydroxyacid dehydrogenase [Succinivibrio sp.]|nr:2-hydroxyacid dehydrogenase [Succinivibrio sp.]